MQDKLALLKVASWAHSVALEVERGEWKGSANHPRMGLHVRETVTAKLLRWLAASVVLGELAKEGRSTESTGFFARSSVTGCLKSKEFTEMDIARKEVDEKLGSLLLGLEGHVSGKTESTSLIPVAAAVVLLTQRTRSSVHQGNWFSAIKRLWRLSGFCARVFFAVCLSILCCFCCDMLLLRSGNPARGRGCWGGAAEHPRATSPWTPLSRRDQRLMAMVVQ